jgi:uncharacterized protein (DUF433 family)
MEKRRETIGRTQALLLSDIMRSEGGTMSSASSNSKWYEERIIRDVQVCGREPVFNGTRVTLRTVLASLATGDTTEEILAGFPSLKPEDIQAAIAFAAASAEGDLPVRAFPQIR